MINEKKLVEIFYETMEEIYKSSIPSASFKELMETSPKDQSGRVCIPFEEYRIPDSLLDEIVERAIKKHHLRDPWGTRLRTNIYLGPSPMSIRETSKKRT